MAIDYELSNPDYHHKSASMFADSNGDAPHSMFGWINTESHTAAVAFFSNTDTSGSVRIRAFIQTTGKLFYENFNGYAITTNGATDGVWSSFALVTTSSTSRTCVLDGNWASRGTDTSSRVPTGLAYTAFGVSDGGLTSPMDGKHTKTFVWKGYGLTEADITGLDAGRHPYAVGRGYMAHGYFMNGDGPVGTRVRDSVGGLHLDTTVAGTPVKAEEKPLIRNCFQQGCG